jgi:DNA-binding IclR family transcriptional regulator
VASRTIARSPLQRGVQLLKYLATKEGTGARIADISAHLSIHRVNSHRLIKALVAMGLVEQAPDLSYHLGFETWTLGLAATRHFVPPALAEGMAKISETTQESIFAMRRAGDEGFCIAAHEGPLPIRFINMRVGARRFLGVGGLSTALLSALPSPDAAAVIDRNRDRYPKFGMTAAKVDEIVRRARKLGYAYSEGVIVPESRTLAVPIPPTGVDAVGPIAISILTTESRMKEPRRSELAKLLKREAAQIAIRLRQ